MQLLLIIFKFKENLLEICIYSIIMRLFGCGYFKVERLQKRFWIDIVNYLKVWTLNGLVYIYKLYPIYIYEDA